VLVHVHNLSFHGHEEKDKKIQQEYGPKDGHVKDGKERHPDGIQHALGAGQPEFEFGEAAGKRSKLFAFFGRGGQCGTVVVTVGAAHGTWIFQRTEKGNEIVEQVDAQSVGHNEIALDEIDAQEKYGQQDRKTDPPRSQVNGGFVQPVLYGAFD